MPSQLTLCGCHLQNQSSSDLSYNIFSSSGIRHWNNFTFVLFYEHTLRSIQKTVSRYKPQCMMIVKYEKVCVNPSEILNELIIQRNTQIFIMFVATD